MHPDPFDPLAWFNLVGEAGCVLWIAAYGFILQRGHQDRAPGLPLVAICMNLAWEFLASWVLPNPVPLWLFFDRVWFFVDLLIVYQLLRYGPALQRIPELQRHFPLVVAGTVVLSTLGLYAFYVQYHDLLGLMGAFMVNLVMSVTCVFMYFARREDGGRGLSVPAAGCKLLGTLGTSIECHWLVAQTQPWLGGLHFLTFLSLSILLFDGLYLYLVAKEAASRVHVGPLAPVWMRRLPGLTGR